MNDTPAPDIIDRALACLRALAAMESVFDFVNAQMRAACPDDDFVTRLRPVALPVERALVDMLDQVLGDELASYFLYEVPGMPNGGCVRIKEGLPSKEFKDWPIRTVDDIEAYVRREVS